MLKENQVLREMEAENALLTGWIDKTLEPSIALLKIDILVREMESDIYSHILAKGKTKASEKSLKRVNEILDNLEKLSAIANQNNTYQLIAKHASIQLKNLYQENSELKRQLEATNLALNAE